MSMMNLDSPDVLVIGAGACGCLVAYKLARQGFSVVIPLSAADIPILTNHKPRKLFN